MGHASDVTCIGAEEWRRSLELGIPEDAAEGAACPIEYLVAKMVDLYLRPRLEKPIKDADGADDHFSMQDCRVDAEREAFEKVVPPYG